MRTRKLKTGNRNLVGQALYKIRKEQGLKAKDVVAKLQANGLSIDNAALSKLEGGHRGISDLELFTFSSIYDVSANDIYKMSLNMKGA